MKSPETYLLDIIDQHRPRKLEGQSARVLRLESHLQEWAADCFVDILESGSHARGTATATSSQIKLLLLLSNDCHRNAGGIRSSFESLYGFLIERYRDVKKHRVSLRIRLNGMDIDVTPARMLPGHTEEHMLYQPEDSSVLQTSVIRHANDAIEAGRSNETRLLKIWFEQQDIVAPAIFVDYLVPEKLLAGIKEEKDNLPNNFMHMLRQLAKRDFNPLLEDMEDPANSENRLSALMAEEEKHKVIKAAQQALIARKLAEIIE